MRVLVVPAVPLVSVTLAAVAVAASALVVAVTASLLLAMAAGVLRRPVGRARLRALAGRRDCHPDQFLDVAQIGQFVMRAQRDGDPVGAGARRAADAVHVALRNV